MRTRSNKKKKNVQNACCSVKPRNKKINKYKSSNRKLFQESYNVMETVNLIDDSDEESTQNNVNYLQVSTVNSDKSGEDVEMENNKSAELSIVNDPVLLNLEQSCFILTDTTLSKSTLRFQNEKPEECGSSTPTTEHELGEPSHSKDIEQVIKCTPAEYIIAPEINRNEELSKLRELDYVSLSVSPTSMQNDCINDDSDIVFVSQIQNAGNDIENSVIVIDDDDDNYVFRNCSKKQRRKLRLKQRALLDRMQGVQQNRRQKKKFNTCDNTSESKALNRVGLREIVIDGSNIAFGHSNGEFFSVRGLYIAIEYFLKKGHKVTAFVPQYRLKVGESSSPAFLQELADKRYVIFTPSREVMGKRITPYDDRFIIQYAHIKEAIVVSNDNYRDLLLEKPEWQSTIENRLLMYTWVEDLLIFPEDPLGRNGPPLSDFLKFP